MTTRGTRTYNRPMAKPTGTKLIAENRRARHDYELLERFEAGMVLTGTEVKSLRDGRVTLAQAYADVRDNEVWLIGAEIAIYDQGNSQNHEPTRDRKLLLHRGEIASLVGQGAREGPDDRADAPLLQGRRVKIELALARGKEKGDKRRDIADREAKRQMERAVKSRRCGGARHGGGVGSRRFHRRRGGNCETRLSCCQRRSPRARPGAA